SDLPRPLTNRTPIRLHTGTADLLGEVVLLDSEELAPGQDGLVQLRLVEPVVCAPGDPKVSSKVGRKVRRNVKFSSYYVGGFPT
ncbi:MAG: hypothetical protein V3R25_07800, partial [Nitrosomonadaceae bacterium]